jgi:hypothetical protein
MRARSRAALFVTVLAAVAWSLVPAAPAGAAAGITVTGLSVDTYPTNGVWVDGTATCSTTTGTATVKVTVSQFFMGANASGVGTTTVSCADQPAHWSVYAAGGSWCAYPGISSGCFQTNSFASALAVLTRNGVQEAFNGGGFPT